MSSYLTTLLTTTTSRYASLRSLIPSNSEQDGDTEDDTHLCRVMRAYYIEKGRPFPAWLPPDPKAPQPVVQPVYTPNAQIGAGYGGLNSTAGQSKLGSLWDSQPPPPQASAPTSLRQGGRGVASTALRSGSPYQRLQPSASREEPAVQARPLPSQRAGSHQTAGRTDLTPGRSGSGSSTGAGTAQDRLKARLWGSAKVSQGQPQAAQQNTTSSAPSGFERGYDAGAYGGGGGGYDNRTASMVSSTSGGATGRTDRPFVAATAPWATNEDEFMGGGYGSGAANGRRPGGGSGLPNGPRGYR